MTLYGETFKEVKTRDAMLRYIKKATGKKIRGNVEKEDTAVYRMDKGSIDNRVVGIELINEKKFFIENTPPNLPN